MSRGLNYGHGYDNRQYGWGTSSPEYMQRNPINFYDDHQPGHVHVLFDDNRIMFEEERRPAASFYPHRVVFEEHYSVPVYKNHHHHGSTEPRKHVHLVEREDKVSQSFDNFGNKKVYKEDVDTEADEFIQWKHKNFELNKSGTFNWYY